MKTKYKFVHFEALPAGTHRQKWACLNDRTNDILGVIEYYPYWEQYVIDFKEGCVFNNQCLRDIADFLTQLNSTKTGDTDDG